MKMLSKRYHLGQRIASGVAQRVTISGKITKLAYFGASNLGGDLCQRLHLRAWDGGYLQPLLSALVGRQVVGSGIESLGAFENEELENISSWDRSGWSEPVRQRCSLETGAFQRGYRNGWITCQGLQRNRWKLTSYA